MGLTSDGGYGSVVEGGSRECQAGVKPSARTEKRREAAIVPRTVRSAYHERGAAAVVIALDADDAVRGLPARRGGRR